MSNQQKLGKVITLNITKGGTGKSTTAINLAITAAHQGKKVAVIDGDKNLTTYSQFSLRRETNEELEATNKPTLPFVKCEKYAPEEKIRPIVMQLKTDFDLIIVDTAGGESELFLSIIQLSDLIIIPTNTNMFDMRQIAPTLKVIQDIEAKIRILEGWEDFEFDVRILFNNVNKRAKAFSEAQELIKDQREHIKFFNTVVPYIAHLQRFDFNQKGYGLSDMKHAKRAVYELILKEIIG